MMTPIVLPAFSEVLGESMTITAPAEVRTRVEALGHRCVYGPLYSRRVIEALRDASRNWGWGDLEMGEYHLAIAEQAAAR